MVREFRTWGPCGFLVLALTACAGGEPLSERSLTPTRVAHVIEAALENVEDIYYRETAASDLVVAGFAQISETYPDILFVRDGNRIYASVADRMDYHFEVGGNHGAAEIWGERVAVTLDHIADAGPASGPSLNDLTDSFLDGLTNGLHPFAHYRRPRLGKDGRNWVRERPGSLNISLEEIDSVWRVGYVRDAYLKESHDLRSGDMITHVEGTPTAGLSTYEMADLIYGPIASSVELTIVKDGQETPHKLTLQRKARGSDTVGMFTSENEVRIVIAGFDRDTSDQLQNFLRKHAATSDNTSGVILDLRGNQGGLLDAVVDSTDTFLRQGDIFSSYGRHKDSEQHFRANPQRSDFDAPLIILTDRETASGAEIIAAAIQDNTRAIVVGQPTFGHGTIKTVLPLPNAGLLSLPWTEIVTPAGYRLDKRGVMPTVCTGGDVTADGVLTALRRGGGTIDHVTRIRDIDPANSEAIEAFRALCPPRSDGADFSLEVARAILEDPALYEDILARDRQETAALN